jgi:SAM-dependent methyltransferase
MKQKENTMEELMRCVAQMIGEGVRKLILSKPAGKEIPYKKIVIEPKKDYFQAASYTEKQVFHENIPAAALADRVCALTDGQFRQINGWSDSKEYYVLISKKGACTMKSKALNAAPAPASAPDLHNRKKNYILEEGTVIPPLVDMGVFTQEGRVVRTMYDKYKQINRFIEIIDDSVKEWKGKSIHVIDFGCGKSYLTFIMYYYLTEIRHLDAQIIGLDLKADVIRHCNEVAEKYGYTGLRFEMGDINGYQAPFDVDMVITLHACDTATDFALYNAICWNARMIFSVPCCQHELNSQMAPKNLELLSRYGIIQERFAALATDAIRANLLEYSGYKTQLLEFIDLDHTPKNILIRAIRRPVTGRNIAEKARSEAETLMNEFGFRPTLYRLLCDENPQNNS